MGKYIVDSRSNKICQALHEAGLIENPDYVRRIIIDLTAGAACKIIVEYFADRSIEDILADNLLLEFGPDDNPIEIT